MKEYWYIFLAAILCAVFGPELWRVCYAVYTIVMVALFGISFFVKDKK